MCQSAYFFIQAIGPAIFAGVWPMSLQTARHVLISPPTPRFCRHLYVAKADHGIFGMTAYCGELFADFKRSVAMRQGIETIEQLKPPAAGTYE